MTGESWSDTADAQAGIQALGEAIVQEFGETIKENTTAQLARGYIGTTLDDATQTVVVVVDPGVVDIQGLADRLSSAPGVGAVSVRVDPSHHTVAELLEAAGVLNERAWHPRAAQVPIAFFLATDSRFLVILPQQAADVAHALTARLGDRVRIKWGTPRRTGRGL